MRVTTLWVYPIKALRGIRLDKADLGPQGIRHDRIFMLCRVTESGELQKIQLSSHPECALFSQEIVGGNIHVRYHPPPPADNEAGDGAVSTDSTVATTSPEPEVLEVPLDPDLDQLTKGEVNLHQSMVNAYRMGSPYDEWFSACFGFKTALLYIGDERRPVLGTFAPKSTSLQQQSASAPGVAKGWLSSISGLLGGGAKQPDDEPDWLTFSDCAPYLITTEASLANVSRRLEAGDMEMVKFRPNIVVDGEGEWEEDFWSELTVRGGGGQVDGDASAPAFALTKMCNRCTSINVDYTTGKVAAGEYGIVLKKLMSDRRVDAGYRYSPVFGRYAFLKGGESGSLAVGDAIDVTGKTEERSVWDWPMKSKAQARFYGQPIQEAGVK